MIIVAGSSNTDMIIQTPHLPAPGETVLGGTFLVASGGKGANQAVAAARCGGKVTFLTRIGNDDLGQNSLNGLRKEGIDCSHINTDTQTPSGVALIMVNHDGENCIAVAPGANQHFSPQDVQAVSSLFNQARIVLVQLEIPIQTVEAIIDIAYAKNIPVILNPAPMQQLSDQLLAKISILTPNENEASQLVGYPVRTIADAEAAGQELVRKGVKTVIITMGAEGAVIANHKGTQHVPAFNLTPIDTTAAGDTFSGALAVALAEKQRLGDSDGDISSVQFASAAAGLSVTQLGAQPSIPTRKQVDAFLHQNKIQTVFPINT